MKSDVVKTIRISRINLVYMLFLLFYFDLTLLAEKDICIMFINTDDELLNFELMSGDGCSSIRPRKRYKLK